MQSIYRFIFNFIILLCTALAAEAQVPADTIPQQDSAQQVTDSLQQHMLSPLKDSLLLKQDSIYNAADTVNQDTVTAATDTVKTKKRKQEEQKKSMVSDSAVANGFGIYIDFSKFASPLLSTDVKYEAGV
ncbi:MAG: hypothetical protein ACOCXH_06685, partial [Cyclobacteriaceae bacterium]